MAIYGVLQGANVAIGPKGMTMGASVQLIDDKLGSVGQRGIPVDDPETVKAVYDYIVSMLPTLEKTAGFPIVMPPQE